MIVFLLLLLVLVGGLVYFYFKNKGIGVDRPLSEGFEIIDKINNNNLSQYYYVQLYVRWDSATRSGAQQVNYDGEAPFYLTINYSSTPDARPYQAVYNIYEINALKRSNPRFNLATGKLCRVKKDYFDVYGTGFATAYNKGGSAKWRGAGSINTDDFDNGRYFNGYHTCVEYKRHNNIDYFPYVIVNGLATDTNATGKVFATFNDNGGRLADCKLAVYEINEDMNCKTVGDTISKNLRTNIIIKDSETSTFEITPNTAGLTQNYGGTNKTNKQILSESCLGTLINISHEFNRNCNTLCNDTYSNIFIRYGIAFNVSNLSLCDGCNLEEDLKGDAQATPPIPPLRSYDSFVPQPSSSALLVSRELTDTGSTYTLRLSSNARYPLGGKFSDPRQTPIKYRMDITVINGNRQVFTGVIDNITFVRSQQVIVIQFIDGTGFKVEGTNFLAPTEIYHETAGDVATFTISTYADLSYDQRYDYYNNELGAVTPAVAGSASGQAAVPAGQQRQGRVGFAISSTSYFNLYTGTVGNTVADVSGNLFSLKYDEQMRTNIVGTFSIVSAGNQPIMRALGAGTYTVFATDPSGQDYFASKSNAITLNGITTRIQIDKVGNITGYNNTAITSTTISSGLSEKADPQQVSIQIRDASGRFIYYATQQPFTIIGNRYPPTQANSTALQECFLIKETDSNGNVLADANINSGDIAEICGNFDGHLATIAELQADLAAGADWCEGGWIQMTQALQRVGYPVTTSASKPGCIPPSNRPIRTNGTIVITDANQSNGIICYGTKPSDQSLLSATVSGNARYFKIAPFNTFKDQWSRKSRAERMEVFAVQSPTVVRQRDDICYALGFVRATKAQLDELAADSVNTADMTVPSYITDDSVRSFVVINESADNSALSITGRPGVNEAPATAVYANYCFGQKPSSRTIKGPASTGATGSDTNNTVTYNIIDYNSRRRVWSKYSQQPYKTYNLTNRGPINAEKNAYRKAALIVNDIQSSGVAAVKRPDSGNAYEGCDLKAYACKPAAAAERDSAPPQLVSRTRKFKAIDEVTPINASDISPEGIQRAINFVLACQKVGGAVPTADNEYDGCEGPCCVPEESENRLDASMFEEACEKPPSSASIEECDADVEAPALNQLNFEPYKLTRVAKAPTMPKVAKCTNTKLSPELRNSMRQMLYKDVHSTLKNEKLFNLRMPAAPRQ